MKKPKYINKVELGGYVGDKVIWKKAKNAKKYCSFQIITNHVYNVYDSDTETSSRDFIRIIVFNNRKKRLVDKLEEAGLRQGMRIRLEGKLQTSRTEYKGIDLIQMTVWPNIIWLSDKDGNETEIK